MSVTDAQYPTRFPRFGALSCAPTASRWQHPPNDTYVRGPDECRVVGVGSTRRSAHAGPGPTLPPGPGPAAPSSSTPSALAMALMSEAGGS